MAERQLRYFSLGDSALTVEFGNTISEKLNQRAINVARTIDEAGFPGLIETVPAYASTTVFFDPYAVRRAFPDFATGFDAVRSLVEKALNKANDKPAAKKAPIQIAVYFSSDAGPDLEVVAKHNSLTIDEVISIFLKRIYRVYMLGFLPGFTYMGELDSRIATPRKETPRTKVECGSVGIAGSQTGIYSLASPGGWQIIGRTDIELFRPDSSKPSVLEPGDHIRFVKK